jgi:hypothetical protein
MQLPFPIICSFLGPDVILSIFSTSPNLCSWIYVRDWVSNPYYTTFNITVVNNWIFTPLSASDGNVYWLLVIFYRFLRPIRKKCYTRGRSYYGYCCWELLSLVVNILSPIFSAAQMADQVSELKLISPEVYERRLKSFNIMHSVLYPLTTSLNYCAIFHRLDWLSVSRSLIVGKTAIPWTTFQIHIPKVPCLLLGPDLGYPD